MKILLIGGTGTISTDITLLLLKQGHSVTLLNRGSRPLPAGATALQCNIEDEGAAAATLQGHTFDIVADFIAYTPLHVQRDVRLFTGKTSQYVFISSASAYQKPPVSPFITESTPLKNPYWQYSRDKIACEEYLMEQYRKADFPVTIVRPSHTYSSRNVPVGLHGGNGSWPVLQRMLKGKPVLVHGDGASLWTFTHSTDFARAFAGLLGNPHAIGQAVHITSDESLTWNQAYGIIAAALGVPLRCVYAPSVAIAAKGKAYGYDFEGGLLGDKANSVIFDNHKIKQLVPGFTAVMRYDEGVREAVAYLLQNPALQTQDENFERFCDEMVDLYSV